MHIGEPKNFPSTRSCHTCSPDSALVHVTIPPSPQKKSKSPTATGVGTYEYPRAALYASSADLPAFLSAGRTATACLTPSPCPAVPMISPFARIGEPTQRAVNRFGTSQLTSPVFGLMLVM